MGTSQASTRVQSRGVECREHRGVHTVPCSLWETGLHPVSVSPHGEPSQKALSLSCPLFLIPKERPPRGSGCVLQDGIVQNTASEDALPYGQLRGILNWLHMPKGAQCAHTHTHPHTCMWIYRWGEGETGWIHTRVRKSVAHRTSQPFTIGRSHNVKTRFSCSSAKSEALSSWASFHTGDHQPQLSHHWACSRAFELGGPQAHTHTHSQSPLSPGGRGFEAPCAGYWPPQWTGWWGKSGLYFLCAHLHLLLLLHRWWIACAANHNRTKKQRVHSGFSPASHQVAPKQLLPIKGCGQVWALLPEPALLTSVPPMMATTFPGTPMEAEFVFDAVENVGVRGPDPPQS